MLCYEKTHAYGIVHASIGSTAGAHKEEHMLVRVQRGVVALEYLRYRAKEVPHFERNAQYIKPFGTQGLRFFCTGALLDIEIDCFCEDLANMIFRYQKVRTHADLLSEDTFLDLCLTLSKSILYARGICVGQALATEVHQIADACGFPPLLIFDFMRSMSEEIWEILE